MPPLFFYPLVAVWVGMGKIYKENPKNPLIYPPYQYILFYARQSNGPPRGFFYTGKILSYRVHTDTRLSNREMFGPNNL